MASQTITYNGVTLPYTKLRVSQRAYYAADRGTQIGVEYLISVRGVVTADATTLAGDSGGSGIANLDAMRSLLLVPRKTLTVTWTPGGGSAVKAFEFVPVGSEGLTTDTEWGPLPQSLDVTDFAGGLAALYQWDVVFRTKQSNTQSSNHTITHSGANATFLSLERTYDFSLDEDGNTTRTIAGTAVLPTFIVAQRGNLKPPGFYRNLLTPACPLGWQRVGQDFHTDASGLTMHFRFTDRERGKYVLPAGVTSGQATVHSSLSARGMIGRISLVGWFGGPKSTPTATLIQRVFDLLVSKFFTNASSRVRIESRDLSVSVYTNRVDFNIHGIFAAGKSARNANGAAAYDLTRDIKILTSKPPGDVESGTIPGPYGNDGIIESPLTQPWDYTNSASRAYVDKTNAATADLIDGRGSTGSGGNVTRFSAPDVSTDHADAPYLEFYEVVEYNVTNNIRTFLPKIAGKGPKFQQVANPTVHVIQAGHASRVGNNVTRHAPQPPKSIVGDTGVPLEFFVSAPTAEPYGDGGNDVYSLRWRYVHALKTSPQSFSQLEPGVPADPRRASSAKYTIEAPDGPDPVWGSSRKF